MGGVSSWLSGEDSAYSFFTARRDEYVFARSPRDTFTLNLAQIERIQKVYFTTIRKKQNPYPMNEVQVHTLEVMLFEK